jgi:hypothetical protein
MEPKIVKLPFSDRRNAPYAEAVTLHKKPPTIEKVPDDRM